MEWKISAIRNAGLFESLAAQQAGIALPARPPRCVRIVATVRQAEIQTTLLSGGLPVSLVVEFYDEGRALPVRGEPYRTVQGGKAVLTRGPESAATTAISTACKCHRRSKSPGILMAGNSPTRVFG
jgi:hypothetical protein